MIQARTIIYQALAKIGAINFGENPDTNTANVALQELRSIVDMWSIRAINFKDYNQTTSAKNHITLGTDTSNILSPIPGDLAERPASISNVFITLNGLIYEMVIKTLPEWYENPIQTVAAIPTTVYVHEDFPYTSLDFYPYFSQNGSVRIVGQSYMLDEDIQLNTYCSWPREYNAAIISTLALRLAPYFGILAGQDLVAQASSDFKHVQHKILVSNIPRAGSDFSSPGYPNILGRI